MTNPHDPVLVDEGKRVRKVIHGENYYLYVSPQALIVTCPRENSKDQEKEREVLETIAESVTHTRGGESI